jgi:hypothetical protein
VGWLVLPGDRLMLCRRLTCPGTGELAPGIRLADTLTQTSCNNLDRVRRTNAFVDMRQALMVELPAEIPSVGQLTGDPDT